MEYPIVGTFVEQASVHWGWFGGRNHFRCINRTLSVDAGGARGRK
jgi:hypothetical protein